MPHNSVARFVRGALALSLMGALPPVRAVGQASQDTTRLTISGRIYDRGTGAPISSAVIRLVGFEVGDTTGDDGRYTLVGLLRRTYPVEVAAAEYKPLRGDLRIMENGEMDFPMERLGGAGVGQRPSRVVGRVLEMETGNPVEGAEITVVGGGTGQVSDRRGHFELAAIAPGTHTLSVRYLGRTPVQAQVEVPPDVTVDVVVRLAVKPVELAPLIVTVTPRSSYLEAMGFYRRRDEGQSGVLVTREDIEARSPRSLAEVLVSVPGLRVLPGKLGRFEVRMRRAIRLTLDAGEGCVPSVFIDDVRSDPGWLQDLEPTRVEAMEIYSGANAPLRYNDPCGVILVWTRRGDPGRERTQATPPLSRF